MRDRGVPTFLRGSNRLIRVWSEPRQLLVGTVVTVALVFVTIALIDVVDLSGGGLIAVILGSVLVGYLVTLTGLASIVAFAAGWFLKILWRGSSGMLHVLPLLLVAVTFFFITAETWQSIGRLRGLPLVLTSLLLASVAVGFLIRRGTADVDELAAFDSADDVRQALPSALRPAGQCRYLLRPLTWVEKMNLLVISVLGKLFVAVAVGLSIWVFFVLFGVLTITHDTAAAWSAGEPTVWWQATLAGHQYVLTAEHARVAAFLGVFSGLYFIVTSASDRTLAASLSSEAEDHVRSCLAVRAVYLASRSG